MRSFRFSLLLPIAFPLLFLSCVTRNPYDADLGGAFAISKDAELQKGEIWECLIEGDARELAELVAVSYENPIKGETGRAGRYVFRINPLREGIVTLGFVKRSLLDGSSLEEHRASYSIAMREGKLVFEEKE